MSCLSIGVEPVPAKLPLVIAQAVGKGTEGCLPGIFDPSVEFAAFLLPDYLVGAIGYISNDDKPWTEASIVATSIDGARRSARSARSIAAPLARRSPQFT
jgi:hypothetical protein